MAAAEIRKRGGKRSAVPARQPRQSRGKRRRHRKAMGVYLLVTLFVLILSAILIVTLFFKVDTIQAKGSQKYPEEQLIQISGIELGSNILRFSQEEIEEKIFERLTFVEEVSVERRLPNTVVITVKDATPALVVKTASGNMILSRNGRLLEAAGGSNLPVVTGFEGWKATVGGRLSDAGEEAADAEQVLLKVLEGIEKAQLSSIQQISLAEDNSVILLYDGRITIKLGVISSLNTKMALTKSILEEKSAAEWGILDVSSAETAYYKQIEPPAQEETPGEGEETPANPEEHPQE